MGSLCAGREAGCEAATNRASGRTSHAAAGETADHSEASLIHTAGFGYEIWDPALGRYVKMTGTPSIFTGKLAALRLPLVFDPDERWEYGINLDWVGRAVEAVSGQPLDVHFR